MDGHDGAVPEVADRVPATVSSEEACASYLFAAPLAPAGFVCPGCRGARAWALKTKVDTFEGGANAQ